MAVIGIDLGTTYCAVSIFQDDMSETLILNGRPTMPSVISLQKSGNMIVGYPAKSNQAKDPDNTVLEVKRKMGSEEKVSLGQNDYLPQELSSFILAEIKKEVENQLGEEVTGAVITCPAYFKDHQRAATKQAGDLAGLNVLRIINEPTAAAFAYGLDTEDENEKLIMVYDLGGGTFDVTVMRMIGGSIEVLGTGGDPQLGGGNFDDVIVEWMLEHIEADNSGYTSSLSATKKAAVVRKLKSFAEDAKKKLCGPPETTEFEFNLAKVDRFDGKPVPFREKLTMAKFEELTKPMLERSMKWLDVAMEVPSSEKYNYTEDHISEILLVGGSTRVPLVRRMLEERYPGKPIRGMESGINPDEIVAQGAGILAATLDPDSDEIIDVDEYVDVTGHTLSVSALSQEGKLELIPIIPKETPIPTKAAYPFSTQGSMQTIALVQVYQGEARYPDDEDAYMIGEFIIEVDPIQDPTPLQIGLDIDANGLLVAHATNMLTGREVKVELKYEDSAQMSPQQLAERQAQLEQDRARGVKPMANTFEDEPDQSSVSSSAAATATAATATAQADAAPADPTATMNPIIKALYDKAISNFARIPQERQAEVMKIVGEMAEAAKVDDQAKMMALYGPLQQLLEGI